MSSEKRYSGSTEAEFLKATDNAIAGYTKETLKNVTYRSNRVVRLRAVSA